MSQLIAEEKILKAKTPAEYIDFSLKSSLPAYKKSRIAIKWMKKTGFTIEDIKYARHRHGYWKMKKLKGNAERNVKRMKVYNYSSSHVRIRWDESSIKKFIENNYRKDYELAAMFKTTIPGIQHLRRKLNLIQKAGIDPGDRRFVGFMLLSEKILRNKFKGKGVSFKKA